MNIAYPAETITHLHLLNVLYTEIVRRDGIADEPLRLLDAGCGNGHLISYLHENLTAFYPKHKLEIYGFDVSDHGVQSEDFMSAARDWCKCSIPNVPWDERLKLISHPIGTNGP